MGDSSVPLLALHAAGWWGLERPRVLRVEHQRAWSLFCAARWRDAGEGRAPQTVPALSLGLAGAGCHGMALLQAWSPYF